MSSHSLWSSVIITILASIILAADMDCGRVSLASKRRTFTSTHYDASLQRSFAARRLFQTDTLRTASRHAVRITNRERIRKNLPPLETEEVLRKIACRHSRDMVTQNYFRHENPDGDGPSDRVAAQHRRFVGEVAENIWGRSGRRNKNGLSLAVRIVEQWMDSPPHRENILRPTFTHVGICAVEEGATIRSTQVLARMRALLASPLPRTAVAGDTLDTTVAKTNPASATIAQYDFWNPNTERQIQRPAPFRGSLHLPKTTGTMRLRFYIPGEDQFTVHQGPEIRIVSPE